MIDLIIGAAVEAAVRPPCSPVSGASMIVIAGSLWIMYHLNTNMMQMTMPETGAAS